MHRYTWNCYSTHFDNDFVESDGDGLFVLKFSSLRMRVSSSVILRNTCEGKWKMFRDKHTVDILFIIDLLSD